MKKTKKTTKIPMTPEHRREALRRTVRFMYDFQKMRIQAGNRSGPQGEESKAVLDEDDKMFLKAQSDGLKGLEKMGLKEVNRLIKGVPIYEWLKEQKGCGPTMSGVIISEVDITRCDTISALWAYSGLAVDTKSGKAVRRKKGEKSNWNPLLKSKLVGVLAGCMLKADSPWRKFYDDYKHRKTTQGWGESDGHRHNAAMRYMIKMFLSELWTTWRALEGLEVTASYAEDKQGREHGRHLRAVS